MYVNFLVHIIWGHGDDANTLGRRVHTVKQKTQRLQQEIGLEVNAKKKTKYMVMSRDQNAGRSHSVMSDNSSFERVEHLRYLGTNLTNQNYIQEGNKC